MSDLANWRVHGPVHTLRTEFAEWDLSLEQWKAAQHSNLARFHPDGRISESESHNPDGSISRSSYVYDAVGRMHEVRFAMNGGASGKNIYFYDERQGRAVYRRHRGGGAA